MILDARGEPLTEPSEPQCTHGITFDPDAAKGLSVAELRKRWPRLYGNCPLGCGYNGIYYASFGHYVMGDW